MITGIPPTLGHLHIYIIFTVHRWQPTLLHTPRKKEPILAGCLPFSLGLTQPALINATDDPAFVSLMVCIVQSDPKFLGPRWLATSLTPGK